MECEHLGFFPASRQSARRAANVPSFQRFEVPGLARLAEWPCVFQRHSAELVALRLIMVIWSFNVQKSYSQPMKNSPPVSR